MVVQFIYLKEGISVYFADFKTHTHTLWGKNQVAFYACCMMPCWYMTKQAAVLYDIFINSIKKTCFRHSQYSGLDP